MLSWGGGLFFNYAFLAIWVGGRHLVVGRLRAAMTARPRAIDAIRPRIPVLHVRERRDRFCRRLDAPAGRRLRLALVSITWSTQVASSRRSRRRNGSAAFYYGWVVLGVAALAMVGTLPGRTQGLGLDHRAAAARPRRRPRRVRANQPRRDARRLALRFGVGSLIDRRGTRLVLTSSPPRWGSSSWP